jgi:hypothetical protein
MSTRTLVGALAMSLFLGIGLCRAETLDDGSAKALSETLRTLQRSAGKRAPGADRRLGSLAESEELYDLASQVFTELTERYGGDPKKMSEALARGKSDPAGFAASLSPATRARLKALAEKMPASE